MEEFDFSVEISDQDWQCFYAQCEECNVLPPAIAALEDSGMSDMDDLGAFFGKRQQKCEIETYHSEQAVADGPPVCEGSPQDLYLGKHHSGGVESVLSDSDEDIHLQSINMFFEQMKTLADSQRSPLQDQVGLTKNKSLKEDLSKNGQSANSTDCASPKNIPQLNSARGVAAGIKTTECVSAMRNKYSLLTDESSSESSASLYVKHPYLKTKLYIDSSSENTENENIKHHYPLIKTSSLIPFPSKVAHTDRTETCTYDVNDDSIQQKNLVANGKKTEDKSTQVSPSDSENPYKVMSKESSPRASVKRKRRKKRRLSVEPESFYRRDRLCSSEDELFTWRRAIDPCFSKDFRWSGLKHHQLKCDFMPPLGHCKLSSSLPAGVEAEEIRMDFPLLSTQHHWQNNSIYIQDNFGPTGLKKIHSTENDLKDDVSSRIPNGDFVSEQELTNVKENLNVTEFQLESVPSSKNTYRNEVKSITNAIFQSAESDDPAIGRGVSLLSAKTVLREEFETEKVSLCHQQLKTQSPITYQSHHMMEDMTPPQCETAISISTVTELLDHTTRHHADMAPAESSAILPNNDRLINGSSLKTEKDSKKTELAPKQEITLVSEACTAQDKNKGNKIVNGSMIVNGAVIQSELHPHSESRNQLQLSSLSSSLSSSHSLETKPIVPLSDVNLTNSSENFAESKNDQDFQDKHKQTIAKDEKSASESEFSDLQNDPVEEPCWDRVEVVMTNSESDELTESGVKPRHTVFAMSSFWKEMEKLTINDILGSRKENSTQSSFLPSLGETDDTDLFTLSDLGCCSLAEERKLAIPDPVECNLSSTITSDSSVRSVRWDSDQIPMSVLPKMNYTDATTVNDFESIPTPCHQDGLKRISKKVSVQNLRALESASFYNKSYCQSTIKPPDEDTCNDTGYFPEDPVPRRDPRPPSMIENFKLSLTDIYSYFFNEEQPDTNLEWPTENIVQPYIEGDSVPENYDHFYSEFDTDTFFYADKEKTSELVPIFSCSRSSQSKMDFHDGYDLFLVSSSDDSHSESDEEDERERAPIRVVTRFTRKASSKDIVTDAYEHFYTDRDLQQDFFKTNFSFRNIKLTDNDKQTTSALTLESPKHQMRSFHIKARPITVLGNQDMLFPDSIVRNFDDQIITRLQRPIIYQNLQTAVANPKLDAPLLPLKQSDMCLICIAFASWVLKTADPGAGDAWKAVLLANVSALSAIRYLRRYFKGENTAGAKKLHPKTPC